MTCPTSLTFRLDALGRIPMGDIEALASFDVNPALCLIDHPIAARVRQSIAIRRHRAKQSTWQNADPLHPAIYRALRIDPADPASFYAAYPFRLAKIDGAHVILAALRCPPVGEVAEPETLISWHPPSGTFAIVGDVNPQLIEPDHPDDEAHIYGDFFAFARAWVERRAAWFQRHLDQMADKWAHPNVEPSDGNLPGYLVVGDITKVRMPRDLPPVLTAHGIKPKALNAAIFRSANLPRVNENTMRIAA